METSKNTPFVFVGRQNNHAIPALRFWQLFKIFIVIGLLSLMFDSCTKKPTGPTPVNIRMTDAPAAFSAVNIDLQGVAVTGVDGHEIMLNTKTGVYNLLTLSAGVDSLIATGSLGGNSIQQVRLILGANNSVVEQGITYHMPVTQSSGLQVQLNQPIQPGLAYNLLLDFDATESIAIIGEGNFQLRPVLRVVATLTGAIEGSINLVGTIASVSASTGDITYSTQTDAKGGFLLSNLPAGVYTVTVTPPSPLHPVSATNIKVSAGLTTNAGVINL